MAGQAFRASPRQARLWAWRHREAHRAQAAVRLPGGVDAPALRRALAFAVERHEMLRTTFVVPTGRSEPMQVIHAAGSFAWREADAAAALPRLLAEERAAPFDFAAGPLLRACWAHAAGQGAASILVVTLPALAADSDSLRILLADVAGCCAGSPPGADVVQHLQYSEWLHQEGRPAAAAEPAGSVTLPLERDTRSERIATASAELPAAAAAAGLGRWQELLARLTGEPAPAIAAVTPGREFDELRHTLGPCNGAPAGAAPTSPPAPRSPAGAARRPIGWEGIDWQGPELVDLYCFAEDWKLGLTVVRTPERSWATLYYDPEAFDARGAGWLLERFAGGDAGAGERRWLAAQAAGARVERDPAATLHGLFEAAARRRPEAAAVRRGGQEWSFGDIDRRANGLARELVRRGAGAESRVGVAASRSPEMIVALLAVLKAGGAYVPLDGTLPRARREWMARDAGVALVLSGDGDGADLGLPALRLDLEETAAASDCPPAPPAVAATADSLAYVLYTSGSTGRPKGVAVTHGGVVNYLLWCRDAYGALDAAVSSPLGFDLTVTSLWGPLLAGRAVTLLADGIEALAAALRQPGGPALLKLTPAHLEALAQLLSADELGERVVVIGGEALGRGAVAWLGWRRGRRLINEYGPTETVVGCTAHELLPGDERLESVPIGRPIANAEVWVLDSRLEPAPAGAAGELYVGGAGLARGYLGRGDLTAERFLPHPFAAAPGARLYRTGDLARWRLDGALEFLGRQDGQVKIRGFRIELGEIESALRRHPRVAAAAVAKLEGRLVAWVAAAPGAALAAAELGEHLALQLPAHMLPDTCVVLPRLPLSANGKVDRRALPAPAPAAAGYVAPRTPVEQTLAQIWAGVLRLPRVGVEDNFFRLGGDSIVSVQIVARARQAGILLTPGDLFHSPTVAALAAMAANAAVTGSAATPAAAAEQGAVQGPVPLTPVQCWFFDTAPPNPSHWNQAVLLRLAAPVGAAVLRRGLDHLLAHHDALRLRFAPGAAGWRQAHAPAGERAALCEIDLAGLGEARQGRALTACARAVQASLDLGRGPLLRAAAFDLGARGRRLMVAVHHLAVDGVSWRVLLDDLQTACRQLLGGAPARLAAKTASFRAWAETLARHAGSPAVTAEMTYWLGESGRAVRPLPVDHPGGDDRVAGGETVETELAADETAALLRGAAETWDGAIDAVLLAALARAFAAWTGERTLVVDREWHGRADLDGMDVSRTVGWFTVRAPLALDLPAAGDALDAVRAVRESLRRLPRQGLGYGLLRYGRPHSDVAAALRERPPAQVSFNYLGQLDRALGEAPLFDLADEPIGSPQDERGRLTHLFQVNARVAGGRLRAAWAFSRNLYDRSTVAALAAGFVGELRRLAEASRPDAAPRGGWVEGAESEDAYALSPLQQGVLFEVLHRGEPGLYVVQLTCSIDGALDVQALTRAWQGAVARHPALRTAFDWSGAGEPLQRVHHQATVPLASHDWRGLDAAQLAGRWERLLADDRVRGFDLAAAPLLRLHLVRTAGDAWRLVWTSHHLILDGWSNGLVLADVFTGYAAALEGSGLQAAPAPPFRGYVDWLRRRDLGAAERYWRRRLAGWHARGRLRFDRAPAAGRPAAGASHRKQERRIDIGAVERLARLGRERQLTLNTLVQGAWALVLAHFMERREVLFGTVVAGRPAELPGSDRMVGLFINTLPVRVAVAGDEPLMAWLARLQAEQVEMRRHEHAPLPRVRSWSEVPAGEPLFETLFVFENYPLDQAVAATVAGLRIGEVELRLTESYPLVLTVRARGELDCFIRYDEDRFDAEHAALLLDALAAVCDGLPAWQDAPIGEVAATALAGHERRRYAEAARGRLGTSRRRPVTAPAGAPEE